MFQKKKRYINKEYIEYIKQQSCCVTGRMMVNLDTGKVESDPHHTETGGVGMKGSDLSCVPLLHELHQECHTMGQKSFQTKYNVNFKEVRLQLLEKWIEGGMK